MIARCNDVKPTDGLNTQVGLLLEGLEVATAQWRSELGEVSREAVLWQPIPNGHSIGTIILHIADVEAFWLHQVVTGQPRSPEEKRRLLSEETQQYQRYWPAPPNHPLSWFLEQHDAIRARTREVLQHWNDPEYTGQLEDETFTLRWLLHHVMTHEAGSPARFDARSAGTLALRHWMRVLCQTTTKRLSN